MPFQANRRDVAQRRSPTSSQAVPLEDTAGNSSTLKFEQTDGWDPANYDDLEASLSRRSSGAERKWWHVPDECIQALVEDLGVSSGVGNSLIRHARCGRGGDAEGETLGESRSMGEEMTLKLGASERRQRTVRFGDDKAEDSLGRMLHGSRSAAERPQSTGSRDPEDGEDRVRPAKWWKVSDERLQELVLELSSSPKAIPGLSSSSSAPCLGTSKDSNDRQSAAERSIQQRMASLRTSTDEISIHIFFVDTGDIMTLRVAPDLRIGPPKPPAKNRFTEVYGLGACTKGFSDVRNFDYKRREFDATKRANWSPPWTESLKGLIQHFAGAHASRQKIIIKNVPTSSDDLTLRSWGVIDGETLQLRIEKKGAEPGETQHGSATASSTLLTGSISLRNSRHLKECKADGDVWMMPRWISQAHPNVLKRAAWDVPGKQGSPMAVFSDGPIWMADADNHALMSVRTKVAGHAGYQNLGR
ncbi:unnamed protein product [Polarella glacialis]|uniref:Uncharacterized protein n=1 Tax=Polarella glacialis TaxID=89957 RepID=A0A813G1E6_POLGL|nr:unnamed protein product [Polarella glacialis]